MNIRDTSSVSIEDRAPCPPLLELYHPNRGPDCTLGGDATAVMEKNTGYPSVGTAFLLYPNRPIYRIGTSPPSGIDKGG